MPLFGVGDVTPRQLQQQGERLRLLLQDGFSGVFVRTRTRKSTHLLTADGTPTRACPSCGESREAGLFKSQGDFIARLEAVEKREGERAEAAPVSVLEAAAPQVELPLSPKLAPISMPFQPPFVRQVSMSPPPILPSAEHDTAIAQNTRVRSATRRI